MYNSAAWVSILIFWSIIYSMFLDYMIFSGTCRLLHCQVLKYSTVSIMVHLMTIVHVMITAECTVQHFKPYIYSNNTPVG